MKKFIKIFFSTFLILFLFAPVFSYAQNLAPEIGWKTCLGGNERDYIKSIQQTKDGGYIGCGHSYSDDGDIDTNKGRSDFWVVKLSETGEIDWQKSFGGSLDDQANSIVQTTDGGYIVAGSSDSIDGDIIDNHGNLDVWILKLDASGQIQWQKNFGGSGDDQANSIQQTIDDGYIIAGWSKSYDGDVSFLHGGWDYWVIKLDNSGHIQWEKSMGGSSTDQANSVEQTSDGGYIITGWTISSDGDISLNHTSSDYWVVKLDGIGDFEWEKSLGGTSIDQGNSIQQTLDGGYIVAGYSYSHDWGITDNHGRSDYLLVKLSPTGEILWQKTYGGNSDDEANSIKQTIDGGYIIAGSSKSDDKDITNPKGNIDYWIVKTNETGEILWQKSFGGSYVDIANCIEETRDGGYIVAGDTYSYDGDIVNNHGRSDNFIVKLDKNPVETGKVVSVINDNSLTLIVYDHENGQAISGAKVNVENQQVETNKNGVCILNNLTTTKEKIEVTCSGFNDYEVDIDITNDKSWVIYLEKSTDNNPYISSVILTQDKMSYDIRNSIKTFNKGAKDALSDIQVSINWQGKTPYKVYLSQGIENILESSDGIFSGVDIGNVFEGKGKKIFVYAEANDGTITDIFFTKLKVNEASHAEWFPDSGITGLNFKLFKNIGFTIPENVPGFGDLEINLALDFIPYSIENDGNKVKLVIGTNIEKDETTGRLKNFSFQDFKTDIKSNANKSLENYDAATINKKIRGKYGFKQIPFNVHEGCKPSIDVMGYGEMIMTESGWSFMEGGIILNYEFKYFYEGQIIIASYPVYYDLNGGIEIGIDGVITDLLPDKEFSPQFDATFKAQVFAEIEGGVGISHIITAGANGKASLNMQFDLLKDYKKIDINGNARFELKILGCVAAKKNFLNGNYLIYETENPNGLVTDMSQRLKVQNQDIYSEIDMYLPVIPMDRDYIANESNWMDNDILYSTAEYSNKQINILQTNIYPDAKPKLSQVGDSTIMVWISDNTTRTALNRNMLVYSVHDDINDTWSEPTPLMDNGMADFYPEIKEGFLVWQKAIKIFDESSATLKEISENTEIYVAKWNGLNFDTPTRITNNSATDISPKLAIDNDNIAAIWTTNSDNNILGNTGLNSIKYSTYNGTSWSEPLVITSEITAITNLTTHYENNALYIAYVTDQDNNLSTTNDRELFLINNNITIQITDNEIIDSNPIFATINGQTNLFWYNSSNVLYKDINSSVIETVFLDEKSGFSDDFSLLTNNQNKVFLMWTNTLDGGAEIQGSFYDGIRWSKDIEISNTDAIVKYPSGILKENNDILLAFNRTQKLFDEDYYIDGQADLCTLEVIPSYNISISNAYFDEHDLIPGTDFPFIISISNKGELEIYDFDITINNENGSINNILHISDSLLPGETKEVTAIYKAPLSLSTQDISIYITPKVGNDYDLTDNTLSHTIGHPDINIDKTELYEIGNMNKLFITLSNNSYIASENVSIDIKEDILNGETLGSVYVGNMGKMETKIVTVDINTENLNFDENVKMLYINILGDYESNIGNNYDYVVFEYNGPTLDFNKDGRIDVLDLEILSQFYGMSSSDYNFDKNKDLNDDGTINVYDLIKLARNINN